MILYNSGPPAKADFVAVELVEGHIRVSMDNGAGLVDLFSESAVNDGIWHQVELQLSASSIGLVIDGHSNGLRTAGSISSAGSGSTSGKYMELTGQVYLGGIESARQARAEKQGVRNANSSLQGCIRRLDVDGKLMGLADARVTKNVSPECGWHYPCSSPDNPPCVESAVCHQVRRQRHPSMKYLRNSKSIPVSLYGPSGGNGFLPVRLCAATVHPAGIHHTGLSIRPVDPVRSGRHFRFIRRSTDRPAPFVTAAGNLICITTANAI